MKELNGPATYKAIAEALPWEIQSTLLSIRDEGIARKSIPLVIFTALYELQLIEDANADEPSLSRLGAHLVPFCTC